MEAKAVAKYVRMSSSKLKPVADLVRGKDLAEALTILKFTPGKGSELVEKVVQSAAANAENNHEMNPDALYVAEISANQGPTMKRWRPGAQGRAGMILKRTSHISVVLKEREESELAARAASKAAREEAKEDNKAKAKAEAETEEAKAAEEAQDKAEEVEAAAEAKAEEAETAVEAKAEEAEAAVETKAEETEAAVEEKVEETEAAAEEKAEETDSAAENPEAEAENEEVR